MSVVALLGFVVALAALIVNWRLTGCWGKELVNLPVILLVTAGSLGLAAASSNVRTLVSIPQVLNRLRNDNLPEHAALVRTVVALAQLARLEGLLSLERVLPDIGNGFLKKGVQLVIDGRPSQAIREILETEMIVSYQRLVAAGSFFRTVGYLAQSFGAIATVSTLAVNLKNIDGPEKVGSAVASSLCGVLYGLLLHSFICDPISRKLTSIGEEELLTNAMLIEGILSLNASENPATVEDRMSSFLQLDSISDSPMARTPLLQARAKTGLFQRRVS